MEHQQPVQTPRPRRRLNPFLRKPLWVVFKEECDYHPQNTAETVVDGSSSSCTTTYGTSSYGVDANNHHATGMLELPQRSNDRRYEEDVIFEYSDHNEDHSCGRTEGTRRPHQTPILQNHHHPHPPRHLTLFDLVSIGVGGTIGSGIFVLNGLIANSYAGPATFLSWTISGFAALLSGCCYAELSGRIPTAGSSYAYAFVALGELPAFVTACMLTLEFLLSGSAVAR